MKTIIAGSRDVTSEEEVYRAIDASGFLITEVVSGGARGVDRIGEDWANANLKAVKRFIPDWEREGKRAGYLRNAEMANYAEALIAIWDGKSRGTAHMIATAKTKGLKVYVHQVSL